MFAFANIPNKDKAELFFAFCSPQSPKQLFPTKILIYKKRKAVAFLDLILLAVISKI